MQQKLLQRYGVSARNEQLLAIRQRLRDECSKPLVTPVLPSDFVTEQYKRAVSAPIETADTPPLPRPVTRVKPPSPPPAEPPEVPLAPQAVGEPAKPYHEPPHLKVIENNGDVSYRRAMDVIPAPGTTMSRLDSRIRFDWCREYMKLKPYLGQC